jgi:hypothetical protein
VNSFAADGKSAIELESTPIIGEDIAVVKVIISGRKHTIKFKTE